MSEVTGQVLKGSLNKVRIQVTEKKGIEVKGHLKERKRLGYRSLRELKRSLEREEKLRS